MSQEEGGTGTKKQIKTMPLNVIRFMDLRKFCKARYTADGEYTAIKDFEDLQPYV